MANTHDGHRARLKQRFLDNGLDSFSDLNALELLLFFAIPRGDVNPLAHELINRFGTFSGVMDAPQEELRAIPGIGENAALFLKLMPQMGRRYLVSENGRNVILDSAEKIGKFIVPYYMAARDELVYLICLDSKLKLLGCALMSHGEVGSAAVSVRRIVEQAIKLNSASAVLTHNHPSGVATPSAEDEAMTRHVRAALKMVNVELIDHIIVADDDFVSMAQSGFFR